MCNRYKRPADRPPDPAFLEAYLRDAQPTLSERLAEPEATEARRVKAVAALLALGRSELEKAGDLGRLLAMPFELRQFLTIAGLRILTAEDPTAALLHLLGQKARGRGRPLADKAFRDHVIAADVQERVNGGSSIETACDAVGNAAGLSPEAVRKIYFTGRDTLEVRATLGLRELLERDGSSDGVRPQIEGQEITSAQREEYQALVAAKCRRGLAPVLRAGTHGMTVEDNLELWSFVRRASFSIG
jgi:hypothetical protein